MPDLINESASRVGCMASTGEQVFVLGGRYRQRGSQSYNIATDTWTTLASDPFHPDHYGSASGAFNGKVFVAGGSTLFSDDVSVYDVGPIRGRQGRRHQTTSCWQATNR